MRKYKDTGRLVKDIKSNISNNILGNKGDLILIEKWTDKGHLIITDTVTKQTFKIESTDIDIDYPDVAEINIKLLCDEGWENSQLIRII